jgi:hypothetical protein
LVGIIEELSFTTVRHRLAALLLRMARSDGSKTPAGTEIVLTATNQDIAAQIGTVRELVSRNLSRFQSEACFPSTEEPSSFPAWTGSNRKSANRSHGIRGQALAQSGATVSSTVFN